MTTTRVLIVDDNDQVRHDLRTALTLAGTIEIVGEAADGLEAIRLADSLKPDVILIDLEMPRLDGYEATRQLRSRWPACRVIVLTVHGYEAARQKAMLAGADDFVVKGAPLESLVKKISERKE